MSSGSSSPRSQLRGRKKNNSNASNGQEKPKPPRRGLGVAQLERLRLQDQLINNYLNHIAPFCDDNSSNHLLRNLHQGNLWSWQTAKSLIPSFSYSSSSTSPLPQYQSNKRMKIGELKNSNANPHLDTTSKLNPSARIINIGTVPLQNQQGEKDRDRKKRNAEWLTLSIESSRGRESEIVEAEDIDLDLKL